ncbi:MAG: SRPBCC family protein [Chloroflexi bacterium]|nr:SRPBCC family protein [Chloroflexota bacterium]
MISSIGIRVAAEPRRVFELARDITRWAELLPHYRRVTVHGRRDDRTTAQMVAVRPFRGESGPGIPVTWRAETWAEGGDPLDLRLRFLHIRGATRGMDVTWHIRPLGDGAEVVIEHRFRRDLPLLGERLLPWFVDRFFTRPIAGRTLRRFKALAEAR